MDNLEIIILLTVCFLSGIIGYKTGELVTEIDLSGLPSELIVEHVAIDKDSTTYKFGDGRHFTSVDKNFNVGDTLVLRKKGGFVEHTCD